MGRLLVTAILDRSGSMSVLAPDVIKNYNGYIDELKNLDQEVLVTLIQFDEQYEDVYTFLPVQDVPKLTASTYFARGSTALYDAVGRTISAINTHRRKDDKVIVVINTDGFENASHEFNGDAVKKLITKGQTDNDYQFVFIGAGIDAFDGGTAIGVRGASTLSVTRTPTGIGYGYANLAQSTFDYATGSTLTLDTVNASAVLGSEDEWAKNNAGTLDIKPKKRKTTQTNATT